MTLTVGFIGLGSQGAPMARRIGEDGFPLRLWARRPESLDPFSDLPVVVGATPADMASGCDVVGICVVSDSDVESVLLGDTGVLAGMAAGGVVLIHSTVHPDTCRRLGDAAAASGVALLDAPVSGGGMAAAAKHLLVMVGGRAEHLERCRPVLDTYGDPVVHLGPIGAGQTAKLLNNLVFTAQITVALETFGLASDLGVDAAGLAAVLANGSGGSRAAGILAASGVDLSGLRSASNLLEKDVRLAGELAAAEGAAIPAGLGDLAGRTLAMLKS